MLPDYVAILSWHKLPDKERRGGWIELLLGRGYVPGIDNPNVVLASPDKIVAEQVGGSSVVFLGSTFSSRVGSCNRSHTESVVAVLERVISSCWGSYVALVTAPGGIAAVLRDPSGSPPTYYSVVDTDVVLSTKLEFVEAIIGERSPIDDDGLAAELVFPGLRGRRTSLTRIKELLPGEALIVSPDGVKTATIWSPAKYLETAVQIAADENPAPDLRNIVGSVVKTLCESYGQVVLTLSGGLDSSIIAVAGRERATNLSLINLVSGSGSGDERSFASTMAEYMGRPLEVRQISAAEVNLAKSSAWTRPRPSARAFTQAIVAQTIGFAKLERADAIINGHGGDNAFCYLHSAAPASELGWKSFFGSVADIATVTECSIPYVAFRALQHRALRRRPWRWTRDTSLLASAIIQLDQTIVDHPWLSERHESPGKRAHITAVMIGLSLIDYLDVEGGVPFIYPLLSQPVIEACLRVPAWMWYEGGVNRAPVRKAYAAMLPRSILARTTKGAFSNFTRHLYRANVSLIREMLLDGYLCRAGIVDKSKLEAALLPDTPAHDTTYNRILRFVDLEAWVMSRDSV